jgi:hypothetical protein
MSFSSAFLAFETKVSNILHSKAAATVAADIGPITSALLTVLHLFGLAGHHVTTIVNDVVAVSQTTLSNPDKLASVAQNAGKLLTDAGLPASTISEATTIAQVAYALAKTEGLLAAPAPAAA